MHAIARFFVEGGITMFPVLLLGWVSLAASITQIALRRRLNLVPAIGWSIVALFVVAALGMIEGLVMAYDSLGACSPEDRALLLAHATVVATNPLQLALWIGGLAAVLAGVACTLRVNVATSSAR